MTTLAKLKNYCSSMVNTRLIKLLTYLGTLPFFLAIYMNLSDQVLFGVDGTRWFITYGLVILSFMAGTLWGQMLNESLRVKSIAAATNVITLIAWFTFLLANSVIVLITMAICFIALYLLELLVISSEGRPSYYIGLRLRVTVVVVIAHLFMLF
jgi:hypothetical protein